MNSNHFKNIIRVITDSLLILMLLSLLVLPFTVIQNTTYKSEAVNVLGASDSRQKAGIIVFFENLFNLKQDKQQVTQKETYRYNYSQRFITNDVVQSTQSSQSTSTN